MNNPRTIFLAFASVFCFFSVLSAQAAADTGSCASGGAAGQFDFWLGDWSVDSGRGHSTVHLALDNCLVIESWGSNTSDHRGENTIAYNPEEKTWYGLFVDNHGRAHVLSGSVTAGSAELRGAGLDENGAAVLKRVRVVRVNRDTVDQIWEKSADSGASWTMDFKMEYLRKKP